METKEWELKEGDITVPKEEVTPSQPRYAILVQIVSVEQPWALEGALEQHTLIDDPLLEKQNHAKSIKLNGEKAIYENINDSKASREKVAAGKAISIDKTSLDKEVCAKKSLIDAQDINGKNDIDPSVVVETKPISKASFSYQFPGAPPPSPEMDPNIGELIAPEPPPPAWIPPESIEGDTDLDELEQAHQDPPKPPPPPPPVTRFLNISTKEFDVVSNYPLWHKLLNEPLLITMYWTSPSGTTRLPFAQARVDLFPVLALKGGKLEGFYKLEKIPEPVLCVDEDKPTKAKKGGKRGQKEKTGTEGKPQEEKDKTKTKTKKVATTSETPRGETLPTLLEGAKLKIALSTTYPFWCEDDILNSVVVEYEIGIVRDLPPKVVEFGIKLPPSNGNTGNPFDYTLAIELPGFFGLNWWEDIKYMSPEEKLAIAQVKFEGGKVEVEEVIPVQEKKPSIIPPQVILEEALRSIRKAEEAKAIQDAITWETMLAIEAKKRLECMEHEQLMRKLNLDSGLSVLVPLENDESFKSKLNIELEPQAIIKWPPGPVVKRFLPGKATYELKNLMKMGHPFRGEVARVTKPPLPTQDIAFDKYHGCFLIDLSPFLEEGCLSFHLEIPFQSYSLKGSRAGIPLIQLPGVINVQSPPIKPTSPKATSVKPTSPNGGGKKKQSKPAPIQVDDDPPLPICLDPNNPLPNNAWQLSKSVLGMRVQTNRPMEPFWERPPQPEISLEDVIPPRPKQASLYDAVQMTLDKFSEFIEYVGADLLDMHQDLTAKELYEENNTLGDPDAPKHRRFETKGEIRKKMVQQLQKQGLWKDIREEMKTKVLKIAAEKYREKKRATLDIGKFEFCNNLYISLSEVIVNTLKKMLEKRKGKKPNIVDNLTRLRQFADEYEDEEDYKGASRCHQERLLGDNLYDPNTWFEYGCFCMRVRPKDHGKAEECWREALTLKSNHLFTLQALGYLMWHRGYLTQAEVIFHNATNLHSEEEHINWVLLSQVYASEGKRDNARSCLKRAEVLYFSRRDAQNSYSPPHQLLSPLWRFPFSISYQALSAQKNTGGLFVDVAMLLLDLHLPNEAEQILGLEVDIYTCTLDNKWCRARAAELRGDLEKAQDFMKEALKIDKKNSTTWLLLGHMRYNYDPPAHYTDALQTNLYRGAIDAFHQYERFLGEGEQYYKFVYLELGYSFFKLGAWDDARKIFLKGCTVIPTSPTLWLAAASAYFYAGDLNYAELALVEGNVLDTSNFKIWAYLTLTCLRAERYEEAEVSFQQGLKCIVDADLLVTIAQGFAKIGNFRDAEASYLESLKVKEVADVRFQLGEMYFKEGKFPLAIPNYEMVVKARDATLGDHSIALSRLTEMQKDSRHDVPINRHLKDRLVEI